MQEIYYGDIDKFWIILLFAGISRPVELMSVVTSLVICTDIGTSSWQITLTSVRTFSVKPRSVGVQWEKVAHFVIFQSFPHDDSKIKKISFSCFVRVNKAK